MIAESEPRHYSVWSNAMKQARVYILICVVSVLTSLHSFEYYLWFSNIRACKTLTMLRGSSRKVVGESQILDKEVAAHCSNL